MTNPDDINKAIEELDNWWRRKREDGLEDSYVDDEYQIIKQLQAENEKLTEQVADLRSALEHVQMLMADHPCVACSELITRALKQTEEK